jgi:glycosyltransferase involved in cell wall biosynthesis
MARPTLSVCVTTYNRGAVLPLLLANLDGVGDELVVLDSYSDDGSVELLEAHPRARLIQAPFEGHYGRYKNVVLDAAQGDWILLVDSDELLGDGLKAQLPKAIRSRWVSHYKLPRYWLAPGAPGDGLRFVDADGLYPDFQTRLFRNTLAFRYPADAAVHEHFPREGRGRGKKLKGRHLFHLDFLLADRATREAKVARYGEGSELKRKISQVYLWEDLPHRLTPCAEPLSGVDLGGLMQAAAGR